MTSTADLEAVSTTAEYVRRLTRTVSHPRLLIDFAQWTLIPTHSQLGCFSGMGYSGAIVGIGPLNREKQHAQLAAINGYPGWTCDGYVYLHWAPGQALAEVTEAIPIARASCGMLWLDAEDSGAASAQQIVAILAECGRLCDQHGVPWGIYTRRNFWLERVANSTAFASKPLWNAYYDDNPDMDGLPYGGWTSSTVEQFKGSTTVCGLNVDLNSAKIPHAPPEVPEGLHFYNTEVIPYEAVDALVQGYPLNGRITALFGQYPSGGPHGGLDIAAPLGTPIRAPAPGFITNGDVQGGAFGNYAVLDHPDTPWYSAYAHMQQPVPQAMRGKYVEAGVVIGHVGMTGTTTGPHVHWGVSSNRWFPLDFSTLRDPLDFTSEDLMRTFDDWLLEAERVRDMALSADPPTKAYGEDRLNRMYKVSKPANVDLYGGLPDDWRAPDKVDQPVEVDELVHVYRDRLKADEGDIKALAARVSDLEDDDGGSNGGSAPGNYYIDGEVTLVPAGDVKGLKPGGIVAPRRQR